MYSSAFVMVSSVILHRFNKKSLDPVLSVLSSSILSPHQPNRGDPVSTSSASALAQVKRLIMTAVSKLSHEDKSPLVMLTSYSFTELLKDEILAPAVISYIMHRINMHATLKGTPSLIMIDETALLRKLLSVGLE